jgi:O-antigen/teichoic acid export membrane protein
VHHLPPASGRLGVVSQASLIIAGQLLSGLVLVVTTPIIAIGLGAEFYGLYSLLFVLVGYSSTLDLGMSYALVKLLAERDFIMERREVDSLLETAVAVYTGIAALYVLTLVLGRGWIALSLLHLPPRLAPVAEHALLAIACSVPFGSAMAVFNGIFSSLLRFQFVAAFGFVNAALYSIGAMVLVRSGAELTTVIWYYSALMACSTVAQWLVVRELVPGFRIVPRIHWPKLQQLFGFGGYMLLNRIGRIGLQELDRLIVARVLSVSMAAYYAVPLQVTQRIGMLGGAVATVAFPVASARAAQGDLDSLRREYIQSSRVLGWLALAPTLVLLVFADQILYFWMNPEFAQHGSSVMRVLAIGGWLYSVSILDAATTQGTGRPGVIASFLALAGAANVVLLLILTRAAGLVGAALAVTLSLVALSLLQVWFCNKTVLLWRMRTWVRAMSVPTLATVAITVPLLLVLRRAVFGLASLILVVGTGTLFCGLIGYRFFLSRDERASIAGRVAGIVSRRT